MTNSKISGFYRLSLSQRRRALAAERRLPEERFEALRPGRGLSEAQADRMSENVLGVLGLPLGLCVNMRIDGRDRLVPMAVEEPSVVAAASHASKMIRAGGGVRTEVSPALMIGQIQLLDVPDPEGVEGRLREVEAALIALANSGHPRLVAAGGGARAIEVKQLPPMDEDDPCGHMVVVSLVVDVRDAMGANAINSMCERIAPEVVARTGGRALLRILSNLSDERTVVARCAVPFSALKGGEATARRIEEASVFAERDPYRATTHNKGIMNGVDSALLAFGQDWRAVEAGAHAFAARSGRYTALARWRVRDGALHGELRIPMAVGTVGGVTRSHPTVRLNLEVAEIKSAAELASVAAAVGLAQNLSALRALTCEGIQSGHMRLHARNVAVEAGASEAQVAEVARRIADRGKVSRDAALEAIAELASERRSSEPRWNEPKAA